MQIGDPQDRYAKAYRHDGGLRGLDVGQRLHQLPAGYRLDLAIPQTPYVLLPL